MGCNNIAALGTGRRRDEQVPRLLDEDLAEARLAEGVVLEVEAIEAVEDGFVGVHVERVDAEVVARQPQRLEDLEEREKLACAPRQLV